MIIFFISKHIIMGWNRRRISDSIPGNLLPFRFGRCSFGLNPLAFINIRTWSRRERFLFVLFLLESIHLGGETVRRLDDSYAELLQTVHRQVLSALHALADLVKSQSCLVGSWTYRRKIVLISDGVYELNIVPGL